MHSIIESNISANRMASRIKSLFKYLLEFLIVAFGVFLGIYASDWQNQKTVNKEKEKTIRYIVEEMETNQNRLTRTIAYHEHIKVAFDSVYATMTDDVKLTTYFDNAYFSHEQIDGWRGIGLAQFDDIAFEGAKMSGMIQEFEIESIQELSRIYKQQQFIDEIGKSALDQMIKLNYSSKTMDVLRILQLITSDYLESEKLLHRQYSKAIKQMRRKLENM